MSKFSKKDYLVVGSVVLVIVLALALSGVFGKGSFSEKKNVEVLSGGKNLQITGEEVAYFGKNVKGYFVRPHDDNPYPGVVLIHENRGLRPEIKTAAEQLAKDGYMVLAVDLLGKVVETQDEAKELTAEFSEPMGVANMRMAVDFLKSQGAQKIASLGWCFGGAQSLNLALSGEKLDATVIYYGRLKTSEEELKPIKSPVLGIFGSEDTVVSVESVKGFEETLEKLGVENEIHVYDGVGHAFANPSGMNYAPKETKDAWEKTLAFLEANLK